MKNLTSTNVRFIALMVLCTISMAAASQGRRPQAPSTPAGAQAAKDLDRILYPEVSWALVIQQDPEPKVVTDVNLRNAIIATGLPWRVRDKATGIEMLLVPNGEYMMGSSTGGTIVRGHLDSTAVPKHKVRITKPFYLARTEVTQAQWAQVMKTYPSTFRKLTEDEKTIESLNILKKVERNMRENELVKGGMFAIQAYEQALSEFPDEPERPKAPLTPEQKAALVDPTKPVENVSWDDCKRFCAKTGFNLPTEAQWEFACRAAGMVEGESYGELSKVAWIDGKETHPVAKLAPNPLGFYDMIGNVSEWCSDWYAADYYKTCEGGVEDPIGPSSSATGSRVLRGPSWIISMGGYDLSNRYGGSVSAPSSETSSGDGASGTKGRRGKPASLDLSDPGTRGFRVARNP